MNVPSMIDDWAVVLSLLGWDWRCGTMLLGWVIVDQKRHIIPWNRQCWTMILKSAACLLLLEIFRCFSIHKVLESYQEANFSVHNTNNDSASMRCSICRSSAVSSTNKPGRSL